MPRDEEASSFFFFLSPLLMMLLCVGGAFSVHWCTRRAAPILCTANTEQPAIIRSDGDDEDVQT